MSEPNTAEEAPPASPLAAAQEAGGARFAARYGRRIAVEYSGLRPEYEALRHGAGLIDLSYRQRFQITGRDRRSWLHGQVTQDIKGLPDGKATYAAVLTPQGRMVCDLFVYALPDALVVDGPAGTEAPI